VKRTGKKTLTYLSKTDLPMPKGKPGIKGIQSIDELKTKIHAEMGN